MKRLLALLAALFVGALLFAAPASAHATLVGSSPVDGSRLKAAPSVVEVDFDQAVSIGTNIGYLHVVDQAGRRVDTGQTVHPGGDASKISVGVKAGLGDGTYTASFRIISADSHPVAGAIEFVVGNGSFAAVAATPSAVNHTTSLIFDVVRWLAFAGLALLGGGWLMFTVWPQGRDDRRARGLLWTGWWVAVFGALAELIAQGAYAAGLGPGSLLNSGLIDATLHTDYGLTHSLRLIALGVLGGLIGVLLRRFEPGPGRLEQLGGLVVVGIAATYAASGHATSEHPQWLALTSDTAHLIAMSAWVGGLVVLVACVLPRGEPDELRRVLPRFSLIGMIAVSTLVVSGTYQAFLGLHSWRALLVTTYGRLVLLKIALLIVIVVFANVSRQIVQRRWVGARLPVAYAMTDTLVADEPVSEPVPLDTSRLRHSVLAELLLAGVVLAATAVLIAEPPGPAALDVLDARPQTVVAKLADGNTATVRVSSRRHGDLAFDITVSGPHPQAVTATAALPAKDLGPIAIPLTASAVDYSGGGVLLPSAGDWVITVSVQESQFSNVVAQVPITLH